MAKKISKSLSAAVSAEIKSKFDLNKFKSSKGLDKNVKFKEQQWIPLSPAFQAIAGVPGIPMGHISLLRGHSDTGKTTALLEAAVSAQNMGQLPVFIITEMKWNWEHAAQMGLKVKLIKDDEGNVIEAEHSEVELLKMNRDIFIYLTGISHNEMNMLDVDSVNAAVATFSQTLEEYKPKGIDKFEFEGEEYLFPKEFLRRNTFGDYIESTHLESTIEIMKHGRFDVLPEQMAILCRRADEEYDDDTIPAKTEKFKELTMDFVWEFSFFLTMQSVKLTRTFQMFLGKTEEEVEEAKIEFLQLDSTTSS